MQHNFSLEEHIIRGKVQFVEEIKTDLNKIQIIFKEINTGDKCIFEVIDFGVKVMKQIRNKQIHCFHPK